MEASKLKPGEPLFLHDGSTLSLLKATVIDTVVKVYNFTVEDEHNYYVGNNKVLVHNNNPCQLAKTWGRAIVESKEASRLLDKLSPSVKKNVEKAIDLIRRGKAGGNQHDLGRDLTGFKAIDIKGSGAGRGKLRVVYKESPSDIYIHSVEDYH